MSYIGYKSIREISRFIERKQIEIKAGIEQGVYENLSKAENYQKMLGELLELPYLKRPGLGTELLKRLKKEYRREDRETLDERLAILERDCDKKADEVVNLSIKCFDEGYGEDEDELIEAQNQHYDLLKQMDALKKEMHSLEMIHWLMGIICRGETFFDGLKKKK